MTDALKAPFPYFGGKSRIAPLVWEHFGQVKNYVEPFAGSLAVLLGNPNPPPIETVNDADAYLTCFWRALRAEPEKVAEWADFPVQEVELEARHKWLVETHRKRELMQRMKDDPDYYDCRVAGYWVWGLSAWIGAGWCQGEWFGPGDPGNHGRGTCNDAAKLPHLGNAGTGVHRKLPHLGDAGTGVHRQLPHLGDAGKGVHRQLPHLGDAGKGECSARADFLLAYFQSLADRLRNTRVCCGDWNRVMGPSVTVKHGITAVFLDPPYSTEANRDADIYRMESGTVAHDVRAWCLANGDNPLLRIALCGYEDEGHEVLQEHGWTVKAWKANGGYALQHAASDSQGKKNKHRERVWFSPHCIKVDLYE